MDILAYIVGGAVVVFLLVQWVPVWRGWAEQGRALPPVPEWLSERFGPGETGVIFFHSPRCGACRAMMAEVDRLAERHGGVIKVDVSQAPDLARRFHVMATPTTVRVEHGRIARVRVGQLSAGELEAFAAPDRSGVRI